jgi:hypothetical protein
LIFQGGKAVAICDPTPNIYIVNRDNMGHVGGQVSLSQTASAGSSSSPAYWASATANYIYNGADSDPIRAYTVSSSGVSTASVLQTGNAFSNGTSPAVSANGTSNGIVWALDRTDSSDILPGVQPVVLHAYNGTSLSELYNSAQAASGRDTAGPSVKFQVPTVVNGKVYVGTQSELDVYGLCPCPQ